MVDRTEASRRVARFVFDGIPPSLKNGQRVMRGAGKGRAWIQKSTDAERAIKGIRADALEQTPAKLGRALFGSNYVAVTITVDEQARRTLVEVTDLGPQPTKGRKDTRRDIHNTADCVMDALQGIVFEDDRQAREVVTRYGEVPGREGR